MENLRLSNSSVKTKLRCELKYRYKYVEGLRTKRSALPLVKGTWIHLLLEALYKTGDWKKQHAKLAAKFATLWDEEKDYYGDLPKDTNIIMKGYEFAWRTDDKAWTIVEAERKIEAPLGANWTYVGKIDVVAENEEGLWLWDHKTFKSKAPSSDYRIVDPQSALYDYFYERLTGEKPLGFMFNYIRTKLPAIPRLLKRGGISRAKNIDTNWITLRRVLKHYGLDENEYREELSAARARDRLFFDRIMIPKPVPVIRALLEDIKEIAPSIRELHEGRRPTRTLTMDCQYQCEYHLLCLTELVGGDGDYIRKHDFDVNPDWEEYDGSVGTEE